MHSSELSVRSVVKLVFGSSWPLVQSANSGNKFININRIACLLSVGSQERDLRFGLEMCIWIRHHYRLPPGAVEIIVYFHVT